MKCCGKKWPATQDRCSSCGRCLIFDTLPIDEERWQEAIASVSARGVYYYSATQIFSEFIDDKSDGRELYRVTLLSAAVAFVMLPLLGASISLLGMGIGLLCSFLLFFVPSRFQVYGMLLLFVMLIVVGLQQSLSYWVVLFIPSWMLATFCMMEKPKQLLSYGDCMAIQQRWAKIHPDPMYIAESKLGLRSIVPHGVKGILLVDQDLLVDFFLRNGFVEKSNVAVLSSRHFAALPHAPKVPIYFLHGSGKHVVSLQKKISMLPIGWRTEDLQTHPNFQEFINKDRLPVDLLSPSELLEATAYAIKNRCTILEYFSKES